MTALVTPTVDVPLSAVSAAALAEVGRDRMALDTGGLLMGIRVPDDAAAAAVWSRAKLLAEASAHRGERYENGLTITGAPPETGHPECGPDTPRAEAAAKTPAPAPRRKTTRTSKKTTGE